MLSFEVGWDGPRDWQVSLLLFSGQVSVSYLSGEERSRADTFSLFDLVSEKNEVIVIPSLLKMPSSSTRTHLLLLSSAVSLLTFAGWSAYILELIRSIQRGPGEISLALDVESARSSFDEKKVDEIISPSDASSSTLEEEPSTEMVTESPLFLGLVLGGSLGCLMAGAWMTAVVGCELNLLFPSKPVGHVPRVEIEAHLLFRPACFNRLPCHALLTPFDPLHSNIVFLKASQILFLLSS